jgi:hypothetical protein
MAALYGPANEKTLEKEGVRPEPEYGLATIAAVELLIANQL